MEKNGNIIGENIYFKKLNERNATKKYCRWLNDPIVNKYLGTRKTNIKELKEFIKEKNQTKNCFLFGIFDKKNNRHIGNIKLEPLNLIELDKKSKDKAIALGMIIGEKSYWGRGIGFEATKMVVDFAFINTKFKKIKLGVLSVNKPAIRIYEKVGFKMKKTLKKSNKHGKIYYDKIMMELIKKDYLKIQKKDIKKICVIIQARMGSKRFPGKMMQLLNRKPIIVNVIDRVKKTRLVDEIILATSNKKENLSLINHAKKLNIKIFVGSENDVLDRFYKCAKKNKADIIVRITGDCPLIDPKIIDEVIKLYQNTNSDYTSNVHPPTFPDGMDVEVFSFKALEKAWNEAKLKSEREHVTPYIWKNKEIFKQVNLKNDEDLSKLRLTVDEKKDLEFLNKLLKKINSDNFSLKDLIKVIKENKELLKVNNMFERNEGYQKSVEEDKNEN